MATPKPPDWLKTEGAIKQWKRRAPEFFGEVSYLPDGGPEISTIERFARLCDTLAKWDDCRQFIEKNGYVFPTYEPRHKDDPADAKRIIKSMLQFPQVAIYRQLTETISRMERDLGIIDD